MARGVMYPSRERVGTCSVGPHGSHIAKVKSRHVVQAIGTDSLGGQHRIQRLCTFSALLNVVCTPILPEKDIKTKVSSSSDTTRSCPLSRHSRSMQFPRSRFEECREPETSSRENAVSIVAATSPIIHIPIPSSCTCHLRGRVRIHLALAAGHGNVYEAAGVYDALLRAALGDLLLLLRLDLCVKSCQSPNTS